MTIKELERESQTYASCVAEAHMHIVAIDKRPIAEGYETGFLYCLKLVEAIIRVNSEGQCMGNSRDLIGGELYDLLETNKHRV